MQLASSVTCWRSPINSESTSTRAKALARCPWGQQCIYVLGCKHELQAAAKYSNISTPKLAMLCIHMNECYKKPHGSKNKAFTRPCTSGCRTHITQYDLPASYKTAAMSTRANHVKPQRICKSKPHTVALHMRTSLSEPIIQNCTLPSHKRR